jgi:nucleotide-binding universal stress UspA family protein
MFDRLRSCAMKILVPVDGSEHALDAVRHALHLVREGLRWPQEGERAPPMRDSMSLQAARSVRQRTDERKEEEEVARRVIGR